MTAFIKCILGMKSIFCCQVRVGCGPGRLDMGEGGRRIVGIVHCLEMYDTHFTGGIQR